MNKSSGNPILLLRIRFPGRPYFYTVASWRATGFWEDGDSLFYKYALWEAGSVLYKDVASGTSVVAVDEGGDIVGMMLGRPVARHV